MTQRSLALGLAPPRERRGLLPLILGALAVGKGLYGAIDANQQKQRNKGFIGEAYRTAQARMGQQQDVGRQQNLETLNARGLLGGGVSPIRAALTSGRSTATDIAGQSRANLEREFGLDRRALDKQYERDLNENKAAALNAQIGSIAGAMSGVASAYGTGQDMASMASMKSGANTPVASSLLSGHAWGGINPVNPLGDPTSSWHLPAKLTINGNGLSNADFNTSGVG